MSCNGCRVLRKGCGETCALRSCLQWIPSPIAQGHATLFLSRFFGRGDFLSRVAAVPEIHRAAVFQSLLYEACGRVVNPVNGVVGLLMTGKWHVCQAAVNIVLFGGIPRPLPEVVPAVPGPMCDVSPEILRMRNLANHHFIHPNMRRFRIGPLQNLEAFGVTKLGSGGDGTGRSCNAARKRRSEASEESEMTSGRNVERKLLNLFV